MHSIGSLRTKLRDVNALFGISTAAVAPALVEQCGFIGFDFVVIDNEHGPLGFESTENLIRAAQYSGAAPVVRTYETDIPRYLDMGVAGIQVPMVEDADQARRIVQACRFPPEGRRSVAFSTRAAKYGCANKSDYTAQANDQVSVILMIETVSAVKNIGSILAVPGVDAIFVGTTDLAYSLGRPEAPRHPHVQEAIQRCVDACNSAGICCGTTAASLSDQRYFAELGMRYLSFLMTILITEALEAKLSSLRAMAKPGPVRSNGG